MKSNSQHELDYERIVRINEKCGRYEKRAADADLYRNFGSNKNTIKKALKKALIECQSLAKTKKDYSSTDKLIKKLDKLKTRRGFDNVVSKIREIQNQLGLKITKA